MKQRQFLERNPINYDFSIRLSQRLKRHPKNLPKRKQLDTQVFPPSKKIENAPILLNPIYYREADVVNFFPCYTKINTFKLMHEKGDGLKIFNQYLLITAFKYGFYFSIINKSIRDSSEIPKYSYNDIYNLFFSIYDSSYLLQKLGSLYLYFKICEEKANNIYKLAKNKGCEDPNKFTRLYKELNHYRTTNFIDYLQYLLNLFISMIFYVIRDFPLITEFFTKDIDPVYIIIDFLQKMYLSNTITIHSFINFKKSSLSVLNTLSHDKELDKTLKEVNRQEQDKIRKLFEDLLYIDISGIFYRITKMFKDNVHLNHPLLKQKSREGGEPFGHLVTIEEIRKSKKPQWFESWFLQHETIQNKRWNFEMNRFY